MYSGTRNDRIQSTAIQNYVWPYILPLELLNRSEIIRRVVGHDNANDTMLRRSAQLLLTPENDHFEGSMHLASTGAQGRRTTNLKKDSPNSSFPPSLSSFRGQMHATFKVIVLGRQEEVCGPSQYTIIRIIMPHDSLPIFRAIQQL